MSSSDSRSAASRFIPREELGSFAAWQPGAIGAAPSAKPEEPRAGAQAARQAGYQDGYRDGLAALDSFKSSFARATSERIGVLVASFDAELLALEQRIAAAVADCATSLARQVVRGELTTAPQLIAQVAQEAVATLLPSARQIRVHVHPDDQALVAEGTGEALAARGGVLLADASVARGGCRVESDIGSVDATLEARWERARAALAGDTAAPSAGQS